MFKALVQQRRERGILFVVDASQTAGVFDIDVQKMNIDILCFTGHKGLLGPQGTGGMYVRAGVDVRPLKSGGSGIKTFEKKHPSQMPTALEAGTERTWSGRSWGCCGLSEPAGAFFHPCKRAGADEKVLSGSAGYSGSEGLWGFPYHGPMRHSNFEYQRLRFRRSGRRLYMDYGIATRTGAHCAPLMHQALGTTEQGAVRFSFSHFNTEEEIERGIEAVRELAE